MKKLFVLLLFCLPFAFTSSAQIVVTVRPVEPKVVVVRPAAPGPRFVWIEGSWRWDKAIRQYVWVEGHWIKLRRGREWVDGHWIEAPGGWKWIPGHWKRR